MPEPWEITKEQARALYEEVREETAEAHRIAWGLFVKQHRKGDADTDAENSGEKDDD